MAVAFVLAELRAKNPVLNVRYFKKPAFATSTVIAFTAYFGTFAIFFMVALYLQVVVSVSPLGLALNFVPLAVGMVASSIFTGRWVAAWGPRIPMATGCLLAGVGILLTNSMITPHVGHRPDRLDHVRGRGRRGHGHGAGDLGRRWARSHPSTRAWPPRPPTPSGNSVRWSAWRSSGRSSTASSPSTWSAELTAIGIPKSYQSLVVSAVTTGAYQSEAKSATAKSPAIDHIVKEVTSAAYGAFGRGLHLSLNIAGVLLLASAVLALTTVYGRKLHLERVKEGHQLHFSVEDQPATAEL